VIDISPTYWTDDPEEIQEFYFEAMHGEDAE